MLLNDSNLMVRENLWKFSMRTRSEKPCLTLWCDHLCINQADNEEKNQKVQNMGTLYEKADVVWTWLGDLDECLNITMRLLSMIAHVYDELVFDVKALEQSPTIINWYDPDRDREGLWQKPTVSAWEASFWLDSTSARALLETCLRLTSVKPKKGCMRR
jgi:hypothetical protein